MASDQSTAALHQETRDENAFVGVCTSCGLEDTLPVSNAEKLPKVGDTADGYICDCENTEWEVIDHDRLVFQRESRFAQGPDISGTWHRHGQLEWRQGLLDSDDDQWPHPVCPVSQLGNTDERVGCERVVERVTGHEGRGAWMCPWHGDFRVFDYPRQTNPPTTEQQTLIADGGTPNAGDQHSREMDYIKRSIDAETRLGAIYWDIRWMLWILTVDAPRIAKAGLVWRLKMLGGTAPRLGESCRFRGCEGEAVARLPTPERWKDDTPACRKHYVGVKLGAYAFYALILAFVFGGLYVLVTA